MYSIFLHLTRCIFFALQNISPIMLLQCWQLGIRAFQNPCNITNELNPRVGGLGGACWLPTTTFTSSTQGRRDSPLGEKHLSFLERNMCFTCASLMGNCLHVKMQPISTRWHQTQFECQKPNFLYKNPNPLYVVKCKLNTCALNCV